ncbi:nucleotide-binding protein [Acinetobacter sp. AYS6]|uniref:nucleotide-binding protein n=1 Tax=Acinetobacter sp. AYS6 TaxID=2983297 RepID=UPI0021D691B3|nr:nucleotide-binding protein [Acinetobacter sp. AYS6]MCU7696946.1 nucleotide-binding protein [Acinetobacter sp. AYS6]
MTNSIFRKIDNTLLDLQASHLQTYENELKKLARLLKDESLEAKNAELIKDIDLENFLQNSEKTQGSMVGSARLEWPDNDIQVLGLKYLLIQKFGNEENFALNFSYMYYSSGRRIIDHIHALVRNLIIPFIRDYKQYINSLVQPSLEVKIPMSNKKVFIVHGHDENTLNKVARLIEKLGLEAIILHEQANRGKTIVEKIEANSDVGFAVVLLTPDDIGKAHSADEFLPRARQNVILELGYFMGKIGRERVCALKTDDLEIPSDYIGVVWTNLDSAGAWKFLLAKELKEVGYDIDISKLL